MTVPRHAGITMETMAHRARYAAAMTAITRRLPFGLAGVIEPNMLGYLLINLCTFCVDLGLLGLFHGTEKLPIPIAVTLSYGTASLVSYVLNRVLNFRSHAGVGRQFPVFVAVSASNYLIFVLGLTDLLAAVGVYYELARVLAACCEGVYLYCMMRWVVFRDVAEPDTGEAGTGTGTGIAEVGTVGTVEAVREPVAEPAAGSAEHLTSTGTTATGTTSTSATSTETPGSPSQRPESTEPVFEPGARPTGSPPR
jgi:putative flippase GtrA